MRGYVLVNETGDPAISWDLTQAMARVLAKQRVELAKCRPGTRHELRRA